MLASALLALAALQEGSWRVAPPPEWLAPALAAPAAPANDADGEPLRWLVIETQLDARGAAPKRYVRTVRAFVDEVDVREGAQVSIDFDPEHEELLLHSLALERVVAGETRRIDQLVPERFTLLRREGGLETQLFDGTHTLVAWLDDVRTGDRLELAYTVRGANPVFDGHVMDGFQLRWPVALARWRHRLLWPEGRPLFHRGQGVGHADVSEPALVRHEGWRELVWEGSDAPAVPVEDALPRGFEAWAWVQITDFASWGEVADWARGLYALPEEPHPSVVGVAREIAAEGTDPLERVAAALRWTQDEVRYLGIELGPHSHDPSPPELVLQRRFGDCKDKSLLLVALLAELGVEARPALVSAGRLERVASLLPTIFAFDHVIVRATAGEQELWLDPTRLHQRVAPEALASAPFGRALVIAPEQAGLVLVPGREAPEPELVIGVRLDAREEIALLDVHTSYLGAVADARRSSLRSTAREELGRQYLNYYSKLYPTIEQLEPPRVEEDGESERIEVRESYRVPGFWKDRDGARSASIEPLELNEFLVEPSVRLRRGPIALGHPVHVRYELDVVGSHPWKVTPAQERLVGPGVSLRSRLSAKGDTIHLEWIYRTDAHEVPPEKVGEYVEWLERAREELVWTLTPPDADLGEDGLDLGAVNWPLVLGLFGLFVVALAGGVVLWIVNPGFAPPAEPLDGPTGLGGWCILLGVRVVETAVDAMLSLRLLAPALTAAGWAARTDPSAPGTVAPWALLAALLTWSAGFAVALLLVPAFFARKRFFRPTFVALSFVLLIASLPLVPLSMSENDPSPVLAYGGQIAWTIGFAAYVLRSVRVRNTFVR